jgi:hypothetical protein
MNITDILIDTLVDSLELFPLLFITYLFLEYLERKMTDKTTVWMQKAGHFGPLIGSLCGTIPQCGFSVVAANLFAARVISIGTLIAIFLSTSDETLPILISSAASPLLIAKIIGYKFVCGIIFGYLIDYIWHQKHPMPNINIEQLCEDENCHCENEENIWLPALHHSLNITLFIFVIILILNILFAFIQPDYLTKYLQTPIFSELLSGLFGLLPNCSASVVLTQLYLENCINISTLISGSLVNGGVGLLVLFRVNKRLKQNFKILGVLYICGVIGGLISRLIF